jgi:hypothetical protein
VIQSASPGWRLTFTVANSYALARANTTGKWHRLIPGGIIFETGKNQIEG